MHSHLGKHTIWIDGLCINQEDPADKAIQVAQMGIVYKHAALIMTVLNSPTAETDFLLDKKNWTSATLSTERDRVHKAMTLLLRNDYWRRAWILQELVLGKQHTMCCGNRLVTFQELSWFFDQVGDYTTIGSQAQNIVRDVLTFLKTDPTCPDGGKFGRSDLEMFSAAGRKKYQNIPLFSLLVKSGRYNRCFEPKDMLYARRDLASDGAQLVPTVDYSDARSVNDVYTDFARRWIANSSSVNAINIITYASPSTKSGLPSWVPDWRAPVEMWQADFRDNYDGRTRPFGNTMTYKWSSNKKEQEDSSKVREKFEKFFNHHDDRNSPCETDDLPQDRHSGNDLLKPDKLKWSGTSLRVPEDSTELIANGRILTTLTAAHENVPTKVIGTPDFLRPSKIREKNKIANYAVDQVVKQLVRHYPQMEGILEDAHEDIDPPVAGDIVCALQGCTAFVFLRPVEGAGPDRRYRIVAKKIQFQYKAVNNFLQEKIEHQTDSAEFFGSHDRDWYFWRDIDAVNRIPEETFTII